jgi:RimJ/RimL family protein N-acetyltransferase
MIALEEFTQEDIDRLISWIGSERELVQFAGPAFQFPITKNQVLDYLAEPNRIPLKILLKETGEVIGHCELNFQYKRPRLSRIFISGSHRDKGYGKLVVAEMAKRLFELKPEAMEVDLAVYDWNHNAINCYKSIGFTIAEGESNYITVGNETWNGYIMKLERDKFFST